jgi:hypothetical protein
MIEVITKELIESSIGFAVDKDIADRIEHEQVLYETLNKEEEQAFIVKFSAVLDSNLKVAGEHRKDDWENGWGENLKEMSQGGQYEQLIPKYHTKSNISRINSGPVKTFVKDFDYRVNSYFVDAAIYHYLGGLGKIVEFGCGTGYHLFRLASILSDREYIGLDWAESSQQTIEKFATEQGYKNVTGKNFNYFSPDYGFDCSGALVYTVASLEQIGDKFKPFVDYLLVKKPAVVVNFEPMSEFLDSGSFLDELTIEYFEKRGYLKGYFKYLKELEKQDKIEIIHSKRIGYGSEFVEGHSLVVWRPKV